jgi:hypothetical protein
MIEGGPVSVDEPNFWVDRLQERLISLSVGRNMVTDVRPRWLSPAEERRGVARSRTIARSEKIKRIAHLLKTRRRVEIQILDRLAPKKGNDLAAFSGPSILQYD